MIKKLTIAAIVTTLFGGMALGAFVRSAAPQTTAPTITDLGQTGKGDTPTFQPPVRPPFRPPIRSPFVP